MAIGRPFERVIKTVLDPWALLFTHETFIWALINGHDTRVIVAIM